MPIYRLTVGLTFPVGGGSGSNTWHLRTTGGITDGEQQANLVTKLAQYYDAVSQYQPTGFLARYDGSVTEAGVADPESAVAGDPWSVGGHSTNGEWLSPALSVCTTWRSSRPSRRGRGRTFLGPFAANTNEADGTPNAGFLTALRAAATDLVNASKTDGNGAFVVWSEADMVGRDFVSSSITDQWAIQKGRRN